MLDLKIDQLHFNIENGAGQEHRIRPITTRAITILAGRLEGVETAGDRKIDHLRVSDASLNLSAMSDEQAASALASTLLDALILRLEG